jgi:hypothetical protein
MAINEQDSILLTSGIASPAKKRDGPRTAFVTNRCIDPGHSNFVKRRASVAHLQMHRMSRHTNRNLPGFSVGGLQSLEQKKWSARQNGLHQHRYIDYTRSDNVLWFRLNQGMCFHQLARQECMIRLEKTVPEALACHHAHFYILGNATSSFLLLPNLHRMESGWY